MGPEQYIETIRPLSYKNGIQTPIAVLALGLTGETGEVNDQLLLVDVHYREHKGYVEKGFESDENRADFYERCEKNVADLKLELGDALWYTSIFLDRIGFPMDALMMDAACLEWPTRVAQVCVDEADEFKLGLMLSVHAARVADVVKKSEWHGKELNLPSLTEDLLSIIIIINRLAECAGTTVEEIADLNVAKLAARFPNGFVERP
ncbi:MAG: hypothetical protein RLZZ450_114 [Pseudomonadota bacterium]|jgi:NTP pyrophosphatase (non-canonical NTP hydrolase)